MTVIDLNERRSRLLGTQRDEPTLGGSQSERPITSAPRAIASAGQPTTDSSGWRGPGANHLGLGSPGNQVRGNHGSPSGSNGRVNQPRTDETRGTFDILPEFESLKAPSERRSNPHRERLTNMLGTAGLPLPTLAHLADAAGQLASGKRLKVLLPLAQSPCELALVRRGAGLLVSYYETGLFPQVLVQDRRVRLAELLGAIEAAYAAELELDFDPVGEDLLKTLKRTVTEPISDPGLSATRKQGGLQNDGPLDEALAFGFEVDLFPSLTGGTSPASYYSDIHATLFRGQLWAYSRGKRIQIHRGAIFPVVHRMVTAMGALVDAACNKKPLNLRWRQQGLVIGVRHERGGDVALTLGNGEDNPITIPALDVALAALPVLRIASELVRSLLTVDRSQSRNLRVLTLREELRRLRREIEHRLTPAQSRVNQDTHRYRLESERSAPNQTGDNLGLRVSKYRARWRTMLDGLDTSHSFLSGNTLLAGSTQHLTAVDVSTGEAKWRVDHTGVSTALSSGHSDTWVVRLEPDGTLHTLDVETGRTISEAHLHLKDGKDPQVKVVAARGLPRVALITEGRDRLVGVDLRTGEVRWRHLARRPSDIRFSTEGRLAFVVGGTNVVTALDVLTGEPVWHFAGPDSADMRFCQEPIISKGRCVLVAGEPGRSKAEVIVLDAYRGELQSMYALGGHATAACALKNDTLVVSVGVIDPECVHRHELVSLNLACTPGQQPQEQWRIPDRGFAVGGAITLGVEMHVLHCPSGTLELLDAATGQTKWSKSLAHPLIDDVPRNLETLHHAALYFVPSARLHLVDVNGEVVAMPPSDLVPDAFWIDANGNILIAEESGHIEALSPEAGLRLV